MSNFERDGYLLLKNCISKKKCKQFYNNEISKLLKMHNINIKDRKTWRNKREIIITKRKNNNDICPLNKKYKNWKEFFDNKKLSNTLSSIHKKWSFSSKDLGWIHCRIPYYNKSYSVVANNWHIDGTENDEIINSNQGTILLPMITGVKSGGGGTIVLPGSHKKIEDYICSKKSLKLYDKINNISKEHIKKEIVCEPGDILIMHKYLVHGSSYCNNKNRFRVFFNISLDS